jgi:hypothetical protein
MDSQAWILGAAVACRVLKLSLIGLACKTADFGTCLHSMQIAHACTGHKFSLMAVACVFHTCRTWVTGAGTCSVVGVPCAPVQPRSLLASNKSHKLPAITCSCPSGCQSGCDTLRPDTTDSLWFYIVYSSCCWPLKRSLKEFSSASATHCRLASLIGISEVHYSQDPPDCWPLGLLHASLRDRAAEMGGEGSSERHACSRTVWCSAPAIQHTLASI